MRYFLLLLFTLPLLGQEYTLVRTSSLSGAVEKLTVQQPSSGAKKITFKRAFIQCSAACVVTVSRNGTAASGTALTPTPLITGNTATATGWRSSNAGSGTVLSTFSLAAGEGTPIDLTGIFLTGTGTTKNLSIATDSITATVYININWVEGTI